MDDGQDGFVLPRVPVNRDVLLQGLRGNKYDINLITAAESAEWFDFGTLRISDVTRAAVDAQVYAEAGLMRPPYPVCAFRYRLIEGAGDDSEVVILIQPTEDGKVGLNQYWFTEPNGEVMADEKAMAFSSSHPAIHLYTELSYRAMWLMLNCKGVPRTIREPGEKLNRSRIKSGKAPLRRVTVIDSAVYMNAMHETERMESDGAGSSKRTLRTHLRRGHLRTYEETGRTIWINPMIINGAGDPVERDHYEVKHTTQ